METKNQKLNRLFPAFYDAVLALNVPDKATKDLALNLTVSSKIEGQSKELVQWLNQTSNEAIIEALEIIEGVSTSTELNRLENNLGKVFIEHLGEKLDYMKSATDRVTAIRSYRSEKERVAVREEEALAGSHSVLLDGFL